MVIFHSYVSLPEGTILMFTPSSKHSCFRRMCLSCFEKMMTVVPNQSRYLGLDPPVCTHKNYTNGPKMAEIPKSWGNQGSQGSRLHGKPNLEGLSSHEDVDRTSLILEVASGHPTWLEFSMIYHLWDQ